MSTCVSSFTRFLPALAALGPLLLGACSAPETRLGPETPSVSAASQPPAIAATPEPASVMPAVGTAAALLEPVSKTQGLPADYVPPDLTELAGVPATRPGLRVRSAAYAPLKRMLADSQAAGLAIMVLSSYRSYDEQAAIFAEYARRTSEEQANRFSARPGQSEHQLGTTVDLTSPNVSYDLVEVFEQTPEGRWLRENAFRYGFVMSYPREKEAITGYAYEPWHFRYVGEFAAGEVQRRGITLQEYLAGRS